MTMRREGKERGWRQWKREVGREGREQEANYVE